MTVQEWHTTVVVMSLTYCFVCPQIPAGLSQVHELHTRSKPIHVLVNQLGFHWLTFTPFAAKNNQTNWCWLKKKAKGWAENENCKSETCVNHTWSTHDVQTPMTNSNRNVSGLGFSCISSAQLLFIAYCTCLLARKGHNQFSNASENVNNVQKYTDVIVGTAIWHALSHFFFGVGFVAALDPERPFSVLSIPDDVTRHSLLQQRGESQNSTALGGKKSPQQQPDMVTDYSRIKLTFSPQALKEQRE